MSELFATAVFAESDTTLVDLVRYRQWDEWNVSEVAMRCKKAGRIGFFVLAGSVSLMLVALAGCQKEPTGDETTPKIVFRIVGVNPALPDVAAVVEKVSSRNRFTYVNHSAQYEPEFLIFFIVDSGKESSVDVLSMANGRDLSVAVFGDSKTEHWKIVACEMFVGFSAHWPTTKQVDGSVPVSEIVPLCKEQKR